MIDQTQATYAAEDLWANKEPQARIRFGDWHEIWPFYYELAAAFRADGSDVHPPKVVPSKNILKAHYDHAQSAVHIPPYERGGSWALTTATAIHEFAHHIAPANAGHGPEFREAMLDCLYVMGWDYELLEQCYAEAGLAPTGVDDGIMAHVSKIYAQAEAPGRTVEEKQAFLERAQTLATRHQIDLAILRKKQADANGDADRERPTTGALFSLMALPNVTYRNLAVELGSRIGRAHGAQCTIRGKSQYLTFYGFPEDIALTELMLTRVTPMMFDAADEYIQSPERKASGVAAKSARIAFCQSFATEVGRRLSEAVRQTTEAAVAEDEQRQIVDDPNDVTASSTALAIRSKELEVADYIAHEFRRIGVRGSWKGSRSSDWGRGSYEAGKSAAKNANLFGRRGIGS